MFKRLIFSFEKTPKLTFTWHCFKKDLEKRSIVENMLPSNHKYKISSFKLIQESDIKNESKFEACVSVNICTEDAFNEFLKEFEQPTSTVYNIYFGDNKGNFKKTVLSGLRKCYHIKGNINTLKQSLFKIG